MHLLLNATHKDRKVGTSNGVVELKRGQFISGRIALAARLEQTERQVRTSLTRLEELGIISIQTTNKFSIYTIENYSKYQDVDIANDQQNDQQETSKRPANDQQTTTKQELNNLNIKELKQGRTKKPFVLPDWINKEHWDAWHLHPKRKNLTNEQKQLAVDQLKDWKEAGLDYALALKNSATNNWQGLFEPKTTIQTAQRKSKMDISGIDYTQGVNADGSF